MALKQVMLQNKIRDFHKTGSDPSEAVIQNYKLIFPWGLITNKRK
jgi:hypothetical protein